MLQKLSRRRAKAQGRPARELILQKLS